MFNISLLIFHIDPNVIKKKKFHRNHSSSNHNNTNSYNDIYNIDNFCSSTVKIIEKKVLSSIICPKFKELTDEELNTPEVSFI